MRYRLTMLLAVGAMALAAPASAQLVNGLPGPNYQHDAPIGTKGGGAPSSLQAPGEREAIAGALRNEMDARNMAPTTSHLVALNTPTPSARPQTVARNELTTSSSSDPFTRDRIRLEDSSD